MDRNVALLHDLLGGAVDLELGNLDDGILLKVEAVHLVVGGARRQQQQPQLRRVHEPIHVQSVLFDEFKVSALGILQRTTSQSVRVAQVSE